MFGRKKAPTCDHRWREVRRTYQPSTIEEVSGRLTDEQYRFTLFGQTTIELTCAICNDVQFRLVTGKSMRGDLMVD